MVILEDINISEEVTVPAMASFLFLIFGKFGIGGRMWMIYVGECLIFKYFCM